MEYDSSTCIFCIANDLDWSSRLTKSIFLTVDMTLTVDLCTKIIREGVDTGNTDTMKTTRNLIGILVELTARMQHGHYNLKSRTMLFRVHIDRDTTSVIYNLYGIVLKNEDLDIICITCKCLVDTVINDLTYKVVKTLNTCVSNIHGWTLAYSLQSFQHLNMAGIVVVLNF